MGKKSIKQSRLKHFNSPSWYNIPMSDDKIQTLKGFRDFLGPQARARQWMLSQIREVFELFGFEPLETPALEYAALLTGKYGEEADKLIYTFQDRGGRDVAMRYDQTVPTARVISQYQNDLALPYKRYQMQPVWRADKPQKGRYREFTQCDIDILGSTSPMADAEIMACTYAAFKKIGFKNVKLLINDRKTLVATLEKYATGSVPVFSIIQTIDKLDKIGNDGVVAELTQKGLANDAAKNVITDTQNIPISDNLGQISNFTVSLGVAPEDIVYTPTLARGLDYYTGLIFEVSLPEYPTGSLGGGGRYDNLIKQLGGPDVPAVGIAFGFDRMIDAAQDLNLIASAQKGTDVLVTVFSEELAELSAQVATQLRAAGIKSEVFPGTDKLEKQLKYADKKGVPFVVVIGPEEAKNNSVTLKNLKTREQETLSIPRLITLLSS